MADLVVYIAALLVPAALIGILYKFIKRRRQSTTPARWSTLVAGNGLLLMLLLSVAFLLGESYFRFFQDATDSFSQTRTSQRWFDRHFQRNNAGFRDDLDYAFRLTPGRLRVSFIGDSFTAGHGIANVEDRFANRIRRLAHGKWEIHVLAEVGRDTGAEVKLIEDLRREGYQFDTVVLVYCLNDINDILAHYQATPEKSVPHGQPGFLVEHSFLINTLYYRLKARFDPIASNYYESVRTAYDGPAWTEQQERLKQMKALCQAAGGRFSMVIFPFVHPLGPNNEYRHIHETLSRFCQDIEVPCLDLLPVLESHPTETLTVSSYDAHPNERAHELASRAIFEWLSGLMN